MFKVEFGIVHNGCKVNELSRALPHVRYICPGGFITGPSSVEELIVIDKPSDDDVQATLEYLEKTPGIRECKLLERSQGKAFINFRCSELPKTFCSQMVEKNRCFKIGLEIQEGGVEQWVVGCARRSDAEQLLEDLKSVGNLTHQSITEDSWIKVIGEEAAVNA